MSVSRQVLCSPFEIPSKPRATPSKPNGDRKKVKQQGAGLRRNIMTDTRVVRRSIFNPDVANARKNCAGIARSFNSRIMFDSYLKRNDVFASPIVTVSTSDDQKKEGNGKEPKQTIKQRRNKVSTYTGEQHHTHVQTEDDEDDIWDRLLAVDAGTQTNIVCTFDDVVAENDEEDVDVNVSTVIASEEQIQRILPDPSSMVETQQSANKKRKERMNSISD
mmetsp:Transcript_1714/g.3862  ORF Transcript_1714/g.3862 Transcript_1714/m.3862 type:complete len:219 (-) Transcript_1714:1985-2641(-)